MIRGLLVAIALCVAHPAYAQATNPQTKKNHDAIAMTVALSGIVLTGAGFGIILHRERGIGGSDPAWVVGGVAVVASGVAMTFIGLRQVDLSPAIGPHTYGVIGRVKWGKR